MTRCNHTAVKKCKYFIATASFLLTRTEISDLSAHGFFDATKVVVKNDFQHLIHLVNGSRTHWNASGIEEAER